jgi:hypothetical protein
LLPERFKILNNFLFRIENFNISNNINNLIIWDRILKNYDDGFSKKYEFTVSSSNLFDNFLEFSNKKKINKKFKLFFGSKFKNYIEQSQNDI